MPRDSTRNRILDAAVSVFSAKGYHQASMDEIAQQAGVAKGTLYYHFDSKEKLFAELFEEGLELLDGKVRQTTKTGGDIKTRLQQWLSCHLQIYCQYRGLARIILLESRCGQADRLGELVSDVRKAYCQALAKEVQQASDAGLVREELTPEEIASFLLDVADALTLRYLTAPQPARPEELERQAQKATMIVLKGIAK